MDVGVVSLLLHGPAEPEYCVDGLLTEGTRGVDVAVRFEAVAAANAFNSGIRAGGNSPDCLFGSIVGSIDSDGAAPRKARAFGSLKSSGRDFELQFGLRSPLASMRGFVYDPALSKLDTYCSTEGASLRTILRVLSKPRAFSFDEPESRGIRELFKGAANGDGGFEDVEA